jgi:PAS domain S-box-containing protein
MVGQGSVQRQGTRAPLLCTATATHLTSVNSEWERLLGWTREELMSRPFTDFVHPNDRGRTVAEAQRVGFAGYEVAEFENRFRARGGQWRRLRWSARADGCRWVAVAVDITDERPRELAPAPTVSEAPVAAAPSTTRATPPPSASWSAPPRRAGVALAARVGLVVVCLAAAVFAAREIGSSSATGPSPAARSAELLRHMLGPLNGAGPMYTLRRATPNPPAMLGPRRDSLGPVAGSTPNG